MINFGSNPFNSWHQDSPQLDDFISSTESGPNWDYNVVLNLSNAPVYEATYDMIMDNPHDVANGVNRVQVVSERKYFNLFSSLIIKHSGDGTIMLVFNDIITDANRVLTFFNHLQILLGVGYHDDQRSKRFTDREKVESLAAGKFVDDEDLIGNAWTRSQFGFSLSYRVSPLRQFVFSVTWTPKKNLDIALRKNGTLLNLLSYDLNKIVDGQELSAVPVYENGEIKFIDYTFKLTPQELGIFDLVRVRIFDAEKRLDKGQFHVTYFSKFEVDTSEVIKLCHNLMDIYGVDSQGGMEIEPYEVDMLDTGVSWTGRSWWVNQEHGLKNFDNDKDGVLYWLYLINSPDEDGFSLHVTGFNDMREYHFK